MLVQLGFAQTITAGVSQGDWFKYRLILDWEYDFDVTPEDFIFADFPQGEYVTLSVQDISGPKCYRTIHYSL